jgi:hypothetical protein
MYNIYMFIINISCNHKDHHKEDHKILQDFFKCKIMKCKGFINNLTKKNKENNNYKIEKINKNEKLNHLKINSSGSTNGWCLITDTYLQYGWSFFSSKKYEHNDEILMFLLNKVFDLHSFNQLFNVEYKKHSIILHHKSTKVIITINFTKDHKISNIIVQNLLTKNNETLEITLTDIIYE